MFSLSWRDKKSIISLHISPLLPGMLGTSQIICAMPPFLSIKFLFKTYLCCEAFCITHRLPGPPETQPSTQTTETTASRVHLSPFPSSVGFTCVRFQTVRSLGQGPVPLHSVKHYAHQGHSLKLVLNPRWAAVLACYSQKKNRNIVPQTNTFIVAQAFVYRSPLHQMLRVHTQTYIER